jgi:hypothetical protein
MVDKNSWVRAGIAVKKLSKNGSYHHCNQGELRIKI